MDASAALLPLAFVTSTLTGAIGLGGGVLLFMLMPGLVPVQAMLPIHAVTQLASNSSRAAFAWRHIDWPLIPPLVLGSLLGATLGGSIYQSIDLSALPAVLGVLVLIIIWLPLPTIRGGGTIALFFLGVYQTSLGMVTGATGPLGAATLSRHSKERDYLVVNTALYMTVNHLIRVLAFTVLGFSFVLWWKLLLGLIIAVTAGSWLGTRLRVYLPKTDFHRLFRWLVSLLALRMIAMAL